MPAQDTIVVRGNSEQGASAPMSRRLSLPAAFVLAAMFGLLGPALWAVDQDSTVVGLPPAVTLPVDGSVGTFWELVVTDPGTTDGLPTTVTDVQIWVGRSTGLREHDPGQPSQYPIEYRLNGVLPANRGVEGEFLIFSVNEVCPDGGQIALVLTAQFTPIDITDLENVDNSYRFPVLEDIVVDDGGSKLDLVDDNDASILPLWLGQQSQFLVDATRVVVARLPDGGLTNAFGLITVWAGEDFNGCRDADYNSSPGSGTSVTVALVNGGGATLHGTATADFYDGRAMFGGLTVEGVPPAGADYVLEFTAPGLATARSSPIYVAPNPAPLAPTGLAVNGVDAMPGVAEDVPGYAPVLTAFFHDADVIDMTEEFRLQLSTDITFSAPAEFDSGRAALPAPIMESQSGTIWSNPFPGLRMGVVYYWRVKLWDLYHGESPWSWDGANGEEASLIMHGNDAKPYVPTALFVGSTQAQTGQASADVAANPVPTVGPLVFFSAIFVTSSSIMVDTLSQAEIQVATSATFDALTIVNNMVLGAGVATLSGNRCEDFEYVPMPALQHGVQYYWRIRFTGVNGVGKWSNEMPGTAGTFIFDDPISANAAPLDPDDLRCAAAMPAVSGSADAAGVGTAPLFTAKFYDPNVTDTGVEYQLQVASPAGFFAATAPVILWDSGRVAFTSAAPAVGAFCPNIAYPASATVLQTGQRYTWRIKFWDQFGEESTFSSVATFQVDNPTVPPAAAATITGISPDRGPTTGGTTVRVSGTGFTSVFITGVSFGAAGDPAAAGTLISVFDDSTLEVVTPARSTAGPVDVTLDWAVGSARLSQWFLYEAVTVPPTPTPALTFLTPDTGPLAGGTAVRVSGSGFTSVFIMGISFGTVGDPATQGAMLNVIDDSTIEVLSPARALPGFVDVTLEWTPIGSGGIGIGMGAGGTATLPTGFLYADPTPTVVAPSTRSAFPAAAGGCAIAAADKNPAALLALLALAVATLALGRWGFTVVARQA